MDVNDLKEKIEKIRSDITQMIQNDLEIGTINSYKLREYAEKMKNYEVAFNALRTALDYIAPPFLKPETKKL